jgi:hypothetical protein
MLCSKSGLGPLFPLNETILNLARLLIVPGGIPEKASPDALHIAAAAAEECEFLLTWNFRHIANVRIRRKSREFWRIMATPKRRFAHPKNLSEFDRHDDEVLRQVYAARDAYAAEHGHDLDRIYADRPSSGGKIRAGFHGCRRRVQY